MSTALTNQTSMRRTTTPTMKQGAMTIPASNFAHPFFHSFPLQALPPEAILLTRLRAQIEYYFSDQNLQKDDFLRSLLPKVPISIICNFPKVRQLYATSLNLPPGPADPLYLVRALADSKIVHCDGTFITPRKQQAIVVKHVRGKTSMDSLKQVFGEGVSTHRVDDSWHVYFTTHTATLAALNITELADGTAIESEMLPNPAPTPLAPPLYSHLPPYPYYPYNFTYNAPMVVYPSYPIDHTVIVPTYKNRQHKKRHSSNVSKLDHEDGRNVNKAKLNNGQPRRSNSPDRSPKRGRRRRNRKNNSQQMSSQQQQKTIFSEENFPALDIKGQSEKSGESEKPSGEKSGESSDLRPAPRLGGYAQALLNKTNKPPSTTTMTGESTAQHSTGLETSMKYMAVHDW